MPDRTHANPPQVPTSSHRSRSGADGFPIQNPERLIFSLQRAIGNRAVGQLLRTGDLMDAALRFSGSAEGAFKAIQRKDKGPKPAKTDNAHILAEIKKRNADLAQLITLDSMNGGDPPAVKGGPSKDGEEHIWKVQILAAQALPGGSKALTGREKKTQVKGHTQITHFIDINWQKPLQSDPEFLKQTNSPDEAFTLTAAEPLFHELLHARIAMEQNPHWMNQQTQIVQDYTKVLQVANSSALSKERDALKRQIGQIAAGEEDSYFEFLTHEKYDANTEASAFGRTYANSFIAKRYAEVIARRSGLSGQQFQGIQAGLAAVAEKFFDKLDQTMPATPVAP